MQRFQVGAELAIAISGVNLIQDGYAGGVVFGAGFLPGLVNFGRILCGRGSGGSLRLQASEAQKAGCKDDQTAKAIGSR